MNCIFCKIINGEIPSKKAFENEFVCDCPCDIGHCEEGMLYLKQQLTFRKKWGMIYDGGM